jgi:hypothetical protein
MQNSSIDRNKHIADVYRISAIGFDILGAFRTKICHHIQI